MQLISSRIPLLNFWIIPHHSGRKSLQQSIVHPQIIGHLEEMSIGLLLSSVLNIVILSFSALIHTNVKHGLTGDIAFNSNGERVESLYEIINIQYGQSVVVGTYRSNTVSENRKRFPMRIEKFFLFLKSTCDTSSMCREIVR